jgi:phosphoribosylcarboxyaminoimidazole (NCAIR) mutase
MAESEELDVLSLQGPYQRRGIFGRMAADLDKRIWVAAALLSASLSLSGCSTSIADLPVVGVPADAPARPKETGAYPAVHDLPQDRPETAMTADDRFRVRNELVAARDRQAAIAAAEAAAAAAKNPAAK